jgi:peptidoglycan hydrolase-like protein with peptidoglycan-binding domain
MTGHIATTEQIKAIQRALKLRKLYGGEIDGIAGKQTRDAIKLYQAARAHEVTGKLTKAELIDLGLIPRPAPKRNPISNFFAGLLVRKGAELLLSNLKGHPIMNMLSGYKTYILAILILASALAENFLGVDVPGFSMGLGEAFAVGLALITGRAGATNDAAKAAAKAAGQ